MKETKENLVNYLKKNLPCADPKTIIAKKRNADKVRQRFIVYLQAEPEK